MTELAAADRKERTPYKLSDVIVELRNQVRQSYKDADGTLDAFMDAYDDAVIDEAEFRALLVRLARLQKDINESRLILTLLESSGSEVALREVEFQRQGVGVQKP